MVADFDFKLGRDHFRGTGWRGLVAFAFVLAVRCGTIVAIFLFSTKPLAAWLPQLAQLARRLIGS